MNQNFVEGLILLAVGVACAAFGRHYDVAEIQTAGAAVMGAALLHIKTV